jgi:hypothetical protein
MAWMVRWWQAIVSTLQGDDRALRGWVEPSNAITRAILAAPLTLTVALEQPVAEAAGAAVTPAAKAPAEAEAGPEVRTRRRRSGRAA